MHIYEHDKEPVIGNERLALAELIRRKIPNVHAGPDVWQATKERYPKAFAHDRRHPNEIGAEIMAQHWFETLLRHDGRDAPEWSRKELAQALQSEAAPPNRRASAEAHDERMNWNRARELRRRVLAGEKLSEEEQEYLQRARQLRRNPARTAHSRGQRDPTTSTELVPLTDMTAEQRYKGRAGLYGDGRSEPRRISKRLSARPAGFDRWMRKDSLPRTGRSS